MLASTQFLRCTLVQADTTYRVYRREAYLTLTKVRYEGKVCFSCHGELQKGETVALTDALTMLCHKCYKEMPDEEATRHILESELAAMNMAGAAA